MKTLVFAVASVVGAIASPAFAAYDRYGNYYDDSRTYYDSRDEYRRGDAARVIDSQPVYAASGTREECWNPSQGRFEDRNATPRDSNRIAGTALGAIVGGVIGHQLGSGRGNDAATVGGALLGGLAGNQIERQRQDRDDLDLSNCRTVATGDNTLQGYDVTYEYNGQQYTTRMASQPGGFLRLGSDIREDGTPFDANVAYSTPTYDSTPTYTYDNNPYGGGG